MSQSLIQPYLFFGGRCEEALKFYHDAIGAEVLMLMRFKESPHPVQPGMLAAGFEDKVMHASFRVGQTTLMASDGSCPEDGNFHGFRLSLSLPTEVEAERAFTALAAGGKIDMPLTKTFWSPKFGMLTDRFGLNWMITITA